CTEAQAKAFLEVVPAFERLVVESGVHLLKYWLEVSEEEQTRRLESRIDDGRKIWKLSPIDLKSYGRWYDYSRARDEMFAKTDTSWAPWYVIHSDDKRRTRLNIITHLLSTISYKAPPKSKVKLPDRQKRGNYREPDYPYKYVPEKYLAGGGRSHLACVPSCSLVVALSVVALARRSVAEAARNSYFPEEPRMNETVGFIGLGTMGLPMASNLAKAGVRLIV